MTEKASIPAQESHHFIASHISIEEETTLLRENESILPRDHILFNKDKVVPEFIGKSGQRTEYPFYVRLEGFVSSPRTIGEHAWLVGGQENKVGEIPLNANTYLLGNVLVDPGSTEGVPYLVDNLLQKGKTLTDVEMVLITHAHLDHMEAIYELQTLGMVAPVIVPEESVDIIKTSNAKKIGMDLYQHGFNSFRIDGTITEHDLIGVSGYSIRARKCPGHAEDQMYYEFTDNKGRRTFVVGDLLLGGERAGWYDELAWKKSLDDFASKITEDDEILAGHHPTVLHKNEGMVRAIHGFGQQHWDLIPGQPGMMMSPWPY